MNWYGKGVLTVIAGALLVISFRLVVDAALQKPYPVSNNAPTIGDLHRLGEIGDPNERARVRRKLFDRIPLVRVQGGTLNVEVTK
jgi:hypothetical protein